MTILELSCLKSMTGLLSAVSFLEISMTGDVWLVLFLVTIPRCTSLSISQSICSLSSSATLNGLTKKGVLSCRSICTLILGHVPISSLRLNAFLFLLHIVIKYLFSFSDMCDLLRFICFSRISKSVAVLRQSSFFSQGYGSVFGCWLPSWLPILGCSVFPITSSLFAVCILLSCSVSVCSRVSTIRL